MMDQFSSNRRHSRASTPSTVLFLAANPVALQPLQLGEECRAIEEGIRAATFREHIRFYSRWAARLDDLMQVLNEYSPSVLHFSGHGNGEQGLCFQTEGGGALSMSANGLASVMEAAGASVSVVVLNACYSEVQAQALVSRVPCVIGASSVIPDREAILYAGAFYAALAYGKSVATAHRQGMTAMQLHRNSERAASRDVEGSVTCAPSFRLLTRPDTDADAIYIAGARRPSSRCLIVIRATLSECSGEVLARVTDELRELTGDLSLEIKYIGEGSVRLTVTLTPEAARRLLDLNTTGKLVRIAGFEVSSVLELQEKQVEAQIALERSRAAAKYRRHLKGVRRAFYSGHWVGSATDLTQLESTWAAADRRLMILARRLTNDDQEAHDLVQETFERAMRQPGPVSASSARAWLESIMTKIFLDNHRRRAIGRFEISHVGHALPEEGELVDESEPGENSPLTESELRAAVEALEPQLRQVVELVYVEQMRYQDAAKFLDVPFGTVATRLMRARRQLMILRR
jgi:RNA polymerase sigma factor (sigma-70 family)